MKSFIFLSALCLSTQLKNSLSVFHGQAPPRKPAAYELLFEKFAQASKAKHLNPVPCSTNTSFNNIGLRSGVPEERLRWRNGFFVHPDPAFTQNEMRIINSALYELNQVLCVGVRIWPQNSRPTGDYAFIRKDFTNSGCYSFLGKQGGKQVINLSVHGCVNKATIIHECIHAIGFDHEHNRPDRDNYINILWHNVQPGLAYAFSKAERAWTFQIPYDYNSIMHYPSTAFSRDFRQPTILRKSGGTIGFNQVISTSDAMKIKRMYNCP